MDFLIKLFGGLMKDKFTGNVQINFKDGHMININKCESIKP